MGLFSSNHDEKSGPPPNQVNPPAGPPSYGEVRQASIGDLQPVSAPGPSYSPSTTYAALLLSSSDKIRILGFPGTMVKVIDEAIRRVWVVGIQRASQYDQISYEWKLSGRPWYGQGGEAVPSRRLIIHLLHALAANGWHLAVSVDLSKKGWDKDTMIFKPGAAVQRYFFSISFNESDKIRIIDPPNDTIKQAFIGAVKTWQLGIQDTKEKEPGCYQMKLRGNPWWTSDGNQVNHSRLLACTILSAMDQNGYELVGSVDMSIGHQGNNSNTSELDSWFFANKL